MPIVGLTDRGMAFPEIGQIRKGAKKEANRPGPDLTYFRVEFDERETKAAETFKEIYKDQPAAIRIILPFNEIERMWDAWLEAYTAGRMVARSDGERVIYQVDTTTGEPVVLNGIDLETKQPRPHPVNNIAGYDYNKKAVMFKASGRLKVIIPELARAAYLTVLTTSKHDIANISDQLRAFAELNKGQIAGIPFILRRRPKKISMPKADGTRVRVTKWMLSIEADPDWVKAKLSQLKTLALPGNGLALLPEHAEPEEEYPDDELQGEIMEDDDDVDGNLGYDQFEEPEQEQPASLMTYDMAKTFTTPDKKSYADLSDDVLADMLNNVNEVLKRGGRVVRGNLIPFTAEEIEERKMKRDAIEAIQAHRKAA